MLHARQRVSVFVRLYEVTEHLGEQRSICTFVLLCKQVSTLANIAKMRSMRYITNTLASIASRDASSGWNDADDCSKKDSARVSICTFVLVKQVN
jgi:hypothetical protein